MKHLLPTILLFMTGSLIALACQVFDLCDDVYDASKRTRKAAEEAREQAATQHELCGIVRRLGARVGRLEESQMSPPSNPLLPMVKEGVE